MLSWVMCWLHGHVVCDGSVMVGKMGGGWLGGIVKVRPWCGVGLLRLFFLCCGVISKLTLLLVLAAPVKRKGARGEVRFPGDPATMCPVLFKGSRSLLLLACCYVPIGGRMLIFKGGT